MTSFAAAIPTVTPSPDAVLVTRLLDNDRDAWRHFESQYSRLMYSCIARVLRRFTGITTSVDIDEVYSALCVDLLANDKRKLRGFDPSRGTKLSSWLGLLANHAAYDFLRSRRRSPKTEELSHMEAVACGSAGIDDVIAARQTARRVKELLSDFSHKDQRFMQLYYGEGLEPEVVATEMGISVKTVYTKKHKIRARLETLMAQDAVAA